MKSTLLLSAALLVSVPAFAQSEPAAPYASQAVPPAETAEVEDPADTLPQQDEAAIAGNAITITATRRSSTVQDTPVAVSVVAGDMVQNAGVDDIRGLQQLTPSLTAGSGQSSATGTQLYIRGIGTAGDNPGFEPAVGVFIDGVYRARAGVAISELPPIERVEVLRGPQGTLFGRNTSAGALSIITEDPEFDLGGFVQAEYGNYDQLELRAMATGGLTDTVAARIDGVYRQRDGYISDVNTDRDFNTIDRWGLRGQIAYDNGDRLQARLIGDYFTTDEECCYAVNVIAGPTAPALNAIAGAAGLVGIVTPEDPKQRIAAATPGRDLTEQVDDWGVSLEVNYDFDFGTLTSITAYRQWEALRDQDIDFSGADRAYRDDYMTGLDDFTQEVRLQGDAFDGALDWLVGGFFLSEKLTLTDTVRFGAQASAYTDTIFAGNAGFELFDTYGAAVPQFGQLLIAPVPGNPLYNPQLAAAAAANPALLASLVNPLPAGGAGSGQQGDDYQVDTTAFAIFTHNVLSLTDNLSLTLGVRWNHEEKDISANLNSIAPTCDFFLNPANAAYTQTLAAVAPSAILLGCNPTINSEFNGVYDGGFKDDEFTGTAKLAYDFGGDVLVYAGYDRGYKSGGYNLDRAGFDTVLLGGDGPQIDDLRFSAETVNAYEVGAKISAGREFSLNAALFYQDFTDYQQLVFTGTSFAVQNVDTVSKGLELDATLTPVRDVVLQLGYAYTDATYDADADLTGTALEGQNGLQLTSIPKHALTGAFTYTPGLTDDIDLLFHIDGRLQGETATSAAGRGLTDNRGFGILNARVGFQTTDGRYRLEFFGENILNQFYNVASFAVPEQTGTFAVYPSPPRFYGVTVRAGF